MTRFHHCCRLARLVLTAAGAAAALVDAAPPPPLRKPSAPAASSSSAATAPIRATPTQAAKPAAAAATAISDSALEREIRARFARSKIRVEGFTVTVAGGVATIEGKTKVIQRKGTATRLAKLAGAKSVVNRIEVDEAALEKAAGNLAAGRKRRAELAKRSEPRSQ